MIKKIKVNKVDIDTRIDRWIRRRINNLTQSFIERNLRKGLIKVNNYKIKSSYKLKHNDIIIIENLKIENFINKTKKINKKIPFDLIKKFKENILFQNDNFIILEKWENIATQGGTKVKYSIDDLIKNISIEYNLVHRLDIETTGLLIISKNLTATKLFGSLFRENEIKKLYLAVCDGVPDKKNSFIKLKILNKNNHDKYTFSLTNYKVLSYKKNISVILFSPITGKTHQLRILSKKLRCPIIGDKKYNSNLKLKKEKLKLHAYGIKFQFNDKNYTFYSKLPSHFSEFLEKKFIKYDYKKIKII